MAARSEWQRWFPAPVPGPGGWWRLIRFDKVGADGKPVGKSIVNLSPAGHPRHFRTEAIARSAATLANQQDGLQ